MTMMMMTATMCNGDDCGDEDSDMVLRRPISCDETAEALGRKNDVSKDVSAPSCRAADCTDGDARSQEDS